MRHAKMTKRLRIGLIVWISIASIGLRASGEGYDCEWDHPCATVEDLTCDSEQCWCEATWDDTAVWFGTTCGYPDDPLESVRIWHSNNPGECDRGPDQGQDCLIDDDCENVCVDGPRAGQTCSTNMFCEGFSSAPGVFCDFAFCDIEAYLLIGMADAECSSLRLEVADTTFSPDRLDVRLHSVCVGGPLNGIACTTDSDCSTGFCGNTLDMIGVQIEGEAGNASLTLDGAVELFLDNVKICGSGGTSTLTVLSGAKLQTDTTD